jgi:hypothetical protein
MARIRTVGSGREGPFPFLARVQADNGNNASAIRDQRAHAASSATDP